MSSVDIILSGAVGLLTLLGIVHFFVSRTQVERVENSIQGVNQEVSHLKERPSNADISSELVELHRKLTQLNTVQENQELRLTDIADTVERRYHRLRMQTRRAQAEGEVEEPEPDPEDVRQLAMDLNGAEVPSEHTQQPRGRLVPKHRRDKYGRR